MNPQPNPNTMSYKKLHEHILQEHDLYLLGDDMQEIIRIVLEINDNKLDVIDHYPLFEHIDKYYGVTLLEGQLSEIIRIVLEMHNEKPEKCTASIERQYKEKGNQLGEVYGAIKEPSNNDQMKTAMQEYIEELKKRRSVIKETYKHLDHLVDANNLVDIMIRQINVAIELAESLLGKEKEQMKDAFVEGSLSWATGTNSEHYYNETYGEKK